MTLATSILIRPPVSVADVMEFCNRELLIADDPPQWGHEWFDRDYPHLRRVGNRPGLGLSAILDVTYRPDGPIMAEFYEDDGLPVEPFGDDVGSMVIGFDTAYGFGRGMGYGCSDLHAYFIVQVAQKFGPVTWQNEYTGEWHRYEPGDDSAALLAFGDPSRGELAVADAARERAA